MNWNRLRTLLLLSVLTGLLLFGGHLVAGRTGLYVALGVAAVMNLGMYWFSDRIVLRMHRARELMPSEAPALHDMVMRISTTAGIPMPKLYVIPEAAPNAFATGRSPSRGVVAVTEGLLQALSRDEVEGVIAHEIAHIRNRDTLVMASTATIGGALGVLAEMTFWNSLLGGSGDQEEGGAEAGGIVALIVAPIAATLIQMSISRTREFLADESAARYTGKPLALASALERIHAWAHVSPMEAARAGTAHMFIENPFAGGGKLLRLFNTHPPTEVRVARLRAMATRAFARAA